MNSLTPGLSEHMNQLHTLHTRPSRLKNTYGIITLLLLLAVVAAGCTDYKGNDMGKLYGQWQVMTIERPDLPTESPDSPRLYMSFNQHLLQLTSSDDAEMFNGRYIAQVAGEEPDLTFSFPYDTTPEQMRMISRWGIDANPADVKVLTLDGSTLKMKVGDNIITLRKF